MTVKKLHLLAIALIAVVVSACQKEPSTDGLHKDFLVYTGHAENVDFSSFDTYFVPDSILLIGSSDKAEYWKDADAQQIVGAFVEGMDAAGYTRVTQRDDANLGVQLSYVRKVTYFVGYNDPYWWWEYPYYWTPGYWGDWYGWHYPYQVSYSYTAGSLLGEAMNLMAPKTDNAKLPVVWDTFISGLLSSSAEINLDRTITGIEQAFSQSPYLKK